FKKNAEKYGVSYSSVLLSLYGFVLSRFSENPDFLITMTLFNRYGIHPDVSNLWGDFTSTNLFGFSRKNGSAFDFFKHTHDQLWDDIAHALYTGLDVQRDLMNLHQLEPTMAISPIVFTCVIGDKKNSAEKPAYFISPDEEVDKRYWIGQTSQSWIDLQATERDGCFSSGWLYVSQLFSDDFISLLNNSYCNFIEYLAEHDWEAPLPEFTLSSKDMSIINSANATREDLPSHSLISLFELQAQLGPNSCAIIDKNGTYHYQTLQKKSQSLACELHKKGITSNQLIAVLCEKGFNQAVATLGVMYTGAAYLPLNVEWPLGRIKDILIEGCVSHLLVSETQWNSIKNTALVNDYHIHRIEKSTEYQQSLSININPNDPAYVIFTSGSTGKPKGVCISHAGAVNTILSVNKKFSINKNDVVLALSELSFDLSVYDLFGVLAAGGTVVFPDQVLSKEPIHWAALIKKHKITLWNSVPQLMQLLLDNAANTIAHLRLVLLSGDWVPISLVTQVKALPS
ncbi:MAG: AMP-binding protein, partial [Gammaproteobacteria bacterium]|nr:AMP-binding protein [Gammaproteobacteria bacterium]